MLKLDFLPAPTLAVFARLQNEPAMHGFTLVGGTALALQLGHRHSEDLDFNIFGQKLPKARLDHLFAQLESEQFSIQRLNTSQQKSAFKINTGQQLDDYVQDYLINGAKVTFSTRVAPERPQAQIDFLQSAQKLSTGTAGLNIMGLDGLMMMKSIVVYDRVKSRDLYDLMVLTRDHGYGLPDVFGAIQANQPVRDKDPEHFKKVATGIIPLDPDDEGFASIQLNVKIGHVYKYFQTRLNDFEIHLAKSIKQAHT